MTFSNNLNCTIQSLSMHHTLSKADLRFKAGSGETTAGDIQITKRIDSCSVQLLDDCATGKRITSVVISESIPYLKGQMEVMHITLTDVLVSAVQEVSRPISNDGIPEETITLSYASIQYYDVVGHGQNTVTMTRAKLRN